jgi:FMN-dependent NADH-azoreductase
MKKLLHLIATPRGADSDSLKVSQSFLDAFKRQKDWTVDTLDLTTTELPDLTAKRVDGKYTLLFGKDLTADQLVAWKAIIAQIERFKAADAYLITTPMWNFTIPYTLKHYLDVILQPKYLFQYTATGPEGLLKNRKLIVVSSRGGDYSSPAMQKMDFVEPYLRQIAGFVGITDVTFIKAEPMNMGEPMHTNALDAAKKQARAVAERGL